LRRTRGSSQRTVSHGRIVVSIVQLEDLVDLLEDSAEFGASLQPVLEYRRRYGVQPASRA
jgi:hypothetical protein